MSKLNYLIEKGTTNDIEDIVTIFRSVSEDMTSNGINQWDEVYPTQANVVEDISNQELFLIKIDGTPIATMTLNEEQDPQYKYVHWKCRNQKVLVIHRLAVHPKNQGQGLAKQLVSFSIDHANTNGMRSIRLDAYAGNRRSNGLYEKLGFQKANGYCYFRQKPIPFYCWEYIIK